MNTESNRAGRGESETVGRRFVEDGRSVSETVVRAVAAASGREAVAGNGSAGDGERAPLDPLYDAINPDALDALFDAAGETDRSSVEITFEYADCEVTVDGSGLVTAKAAPSPGA